MAAYTNTSVNSDRAEGTNDEYSDIYYPVTVYTLAWSKHEVHCKDRMLKYNGPVE